MEQSAAETDRHARSAAGNISQVEGVVGLENEKYCNIQPLVFSVLQFFLPFIISTFLSHPAYR